MVGLYQQQRQMSLARATLVAMRTHPLTEVLSGSATVRKKGASARFLRPVGWHDRVSAFALWQIERLPCGTHPDIFIDRLHRDSARIHMQPIRLSAFVAVAWWIGRQ